FFFFQAEDGIRDKLVTGVQTCALRSRNPGPKSETSGSPGPAGSRNDDRTLSWLESRPGPTAAPPASALAAFALPHPSSPDACERSEERRVGKECRYRWSADTRRKC